MLSRCSMHSTSATRGLFSALSAPATATRRRLSRATGPISTPGAEPASEANNGEGSAASHAPASSSTYRPTPQGLSQELQDRPVFKQNASARPAGARPAYQAPQRKRSVPYVPPSQGGTSLAQHNHLSVHGSNAHYKAGQMYTPSDLDESQRMGNPPVAPTLNTIQFDVFKAMGTDPLKSYKDATLLSNFVTETGMLMHRKHTKLSAKNQRKLTKAVKRARAMGLMPYTYRMETETSRNRNVNAAEYLNLAPRY